MTDAALERLRAEAARNDYGSMVRLARGLYAAGFGPRQVLRTCYGADFPEEVFVLAEGGLWRPDLLARFTNQPWQLAVPPEHDGTQETPSSLVRTELRLLAEDPDLLPLLRIPAAAPGKDDRIICYRLGELRAGRSTVFRLFGRGSARDALECGDCVLDVLVAEHAAYVRALERQRDDPSNWGAGSVDDVEVEEAHEGLEEVRELRRQAGLRAAARRED
ncbi:hypothetical protein [Streptomyces fradiae]|uniref:hypothetical protein n=1 Tax=Streptomyces fradiae TaxID=1906 RepID=UPI00379B9376